MAEPAPAPTLLDRLSPLAGPDLLRTESGPDMPTLVVRPEAARRILAALREDPALRFEYLVDLTAADYLDYPREREGRFGIVYHLHSFVLAARVRVQAFLPAASPSIDSVADLWGNAEWLEREVFDLFGVRFSGNPDLRRILMPDEYQGHPLRKDYPLRGRGERESFPEVRV